MKGWIVGKHSRLSCYKQQNASTKRKNSTVLVEGGEIMQITENFTSHLEISSAAWTEESGSFLTTFMLACTYCVLALPSSVVTTPQHSHVCRKEI